MAAELFQAIKRKEDARRYVQMYTEYLDMLPRVFIDEYIRGRGYPILSAIDFFHLRDCLKIVDPGLKEWTYLTTAMGVNQCDTLVPQRTKDMVNGYVRSLRGPDPMCLVAAGNANYKWRHIDSDIGIYIPQDVKEGTGMYFCMEDGIFECETCDLKIDWKRITDTGKFVGCYSKRSMEEIRAAMIMLNRNCGSDVRRIRALPGAAAIHAVDMGASLRHNSAIRSIYVETIKEIRARSAPMVDNVDITED